MPQIVVDFSPLLYDAGSALIPFFDKIPEFCHWRTQTCDDLRAFFLGSARGNAALLRKPPRCGKFSAVERAPRAEGALYARVTGARNGSVSRLITDCFILVKAHLEANARATVGEVRAALRGTVETCVAALAAGCQRIIDAGAPDQVRFDIRTYAGDTYVTRDSHPVKLTGRASGLIVLVLSNMECYAEKGPYERISNNSIARLRLFKTYLSLEFGRAVATLCEANPNLRVVYTIDISDLANVLHFGEEVQLAKVAPIRPSQPADVQALLEHYLGRRASSDVDWRRAAERLTGPPSLACLFLRVSERRRGSDAGKAGGGPLSGGKGTSEANRAFFQSVREVQSNCSGGVDSRLGRTERERGERRSGAAGDSPGEVGGSRGAGNLDTGAGRRRGGRHLSLPLPKGIAR
ncbi:hypothetical protein KFL_000940210 [Klebsormidium nitens]|uniref:Uncharacterized protein n=1 Tax=Klebsormidium nitens TaxID=105231 RepID=A0A1Y1HVS2_KLENI|nr:hypothetical protein KFL_000940210 [Klebsormidium nitens]|eukprot:GAQ81912.1 hypothetical protein KFL_000940210 [Klebsormidium nitens]